MIKRAKQNTKIVKTSQVSSSKNNKKSIMYMLVIDGVKIAEDTKKFTFLEAAAQAFVFFLAGFETSSTTMQFAFYELSLHQDIQDKAREEILRVLAKHDGKITYESIYEMDYLGRVIDGK